MRSVINQFFVAATLGITCAVASAADAAGGLIRTLAQGIPHSALFGVTFDGEAGVAVGLGGSIVTSSDNGNSWAPVKQTVTEAALLAVARRGTHTIAVGQSGVVLVEESPGTCDLLP